tara:strand:+ start:1322 stop:1771 length:450 start_codon:yes stop_codon:yes gene_type:complete
MAFLGRTTKGSSLTAIELDNNFLSHYPIGAIYMNANRSDSPNRYIGYGTWSKFAEGRVLISADSTETSVPINESPSGSLSHTLVANDLPAHKHNFHRIGNNERDKDNGFAMTAESGSSTDRFSNSTGGGGSHNNVQPYVTVYMWERTDT